MNELLNRLKNSVNMQILNKVETTLLEQYKFVPISVKDNYLFVAINSSKIFCVLSSAYSETYPGRAILVPPFQNVPHCLSTC